MCFDAQCTIQPISRNAIYSKWPSELMNRRVDESRPFSFTMCFFCRKSENICALN